MSRIAYGRRNEGGGVAQLQNGDYRSALRIVQAIGAAADDVNGFARTGVELLPKVVASEITTLSICDLATGRRDVIAAPGCRLGAEDRASFDRHFHAHPLVRFHAYERGRTTRRISDSVPFSTFRRSALYDEYYRRVGLDHAIALPVFVDRRWLVSFVLNRTGRDFSDRDVSVLELTRRSLGALYRRASELEALRTTARGLRELLESATAGVVRIDASRRIVEASPAAAELIRRYCGANLRKGAALPAALATWVASLEAGPKGDAAFGRGFALARDGDQLKVQAFAAAGGALHLVLEETMCAASAVDRAELPLTAREREVLRWVAAGKTDRDIAAILAISPRTVHKHLQRIYEKLGVETRTAAAMRALVPH
jgi:DNA-binding CsgD family transcriptional regulator/PAS domain-containing protein